MKKVRLAIYIIVMMTFLVACGEKQAEVKTEPTSSSLLEQTVVEISTVDVARDANAFYKMLQTGLIAHDYDSLQKLMQEPFTIAGWQAESSQMDTQSAVAELRSRFLPENSTITFTPLDNTGTLLGGMDPYTMWGPNATIVNILFSQGWGNDGAAEVLLMVSQAEDGLFHWYGILYAPTGFTQAVIQPEQQAQPETPTENGELAAFQASLISALTAETPDDHVLMSMMSNPFITEGWMGSGAPWAPAEAVGVLKTDCFPAASPEMYFTQYDFSQLLNGQDPFIRYATAEGFIFSQGWGADGTNEVLLVISRAADGTLQWSYLLTASNGFHSLP